MLSTELDVSISITMLYVIPLFKSVHYHILYNYIICYLIVITLCNSYILYMCVHVCIYHRVMSLYADIHYTSFVTSIHLTLYKAIYYTYVSFTSHITCVAIRRICICTSDIAMGAGIIYCTRNRSWTVVRGRLATTRCRRRRLPPRRVVASCGGR